MNLYPRAVYFKDGKAIGAGFTASSREADRMEVIRLPSDHYDFLGPLKVEGKTKDQIEQEVKSYEQKEASAKAE